MDKAMVKKEHMLPVDGRDSLFFNVDLFAHAQRVAKMLCHSTMVPQHFQGEQNIGNVMIALNYASRVGADPFMLMQNMCVVYGKPGLEAKLVIALINKCGRFDPLDFEVHGNITKPINDEDGCEAWAIDRATGQKLTGPKITWKMVRAEGWYDKKGSKWQTMPEIMFRYRSSAFFARLYCPEVTLGIQTKEELYDIVDAVKDGSGSYAVVTPDDITAAAHFASEEPAEPAKNQKLKKEAEEPAQQPTQAESPTPENPESSGAIEALKEAMEIAGSSIVAQATTDVFGVKKLNYDNMNEADAKELAARINELLDQAS